MHYNKVVQQTSNKQKIIVKELIAAVTFLLIYNLLKTIYSAYTIFDFIMFVQYLLHNNETFFYIDHALSRLSKTKIIFENYCLIDTKLF